MTDTVFLLLCPCILMLFNDLRLIIVHTGTGHNARLCSSVHCQFIYVIAGICLLYQLPLPQHLIQKVSGLLIDTCIIHIRTFRKLCFCPVNPQKRQGIFYRFSTCLLSVIYIIGERGNPLFQPYPGPDCTKGSDICHCLSSHSFVMQSYINHCFYFNKSAV